MTESEKDIAHAAIRALFEKLGIADAFYVCITIDGTHLSSYRAGIYNREDYSNVERIQRLTGAVECLKTQMIFAHTCPAEADDPLNPAGDES